MRLLEKDLVVHRTTTRYRSGSFEFIHEEDFVRETHRASIRGVHLTDAQAVSKIFVQSPVSALAHPLVLDLPKSWDGLERLAVFTGSPTPDGSILSLRGQVATKAKEPDSPAFSGGPGEPPPVPASSSGLSVEG
jgi:hypothetical protein